MGVVAWRLGGTKTTCSLYIDVRGVQVSTSDGGVRSFVLCASLGPGSRHSTGSCVYFTILSIIHYPDQFSRLREEERKKEEKRKGKLIKEG